MDYDVADVSCQLWRFDNHRGHALQVLPRGFMKDAAQGFLIEVADVAMKWLWIVGGADVLLAEDIL
jgi:hypothetical protein